MSRRKVIILGATGSVGTTALNAIKRFNETFEVVALSANSSTQKLASIAKEFNCDKICLSDEKVQTPPDFKGHLFKGEQGLLEMIQQTDADIVLNAIGTSSGIKSSFATVESGKDLALANKESMVMAGSLLLETAKKNSVKIVPVDSEHITLWNLLNAFGTKRVTKLILTASGGPFRNLELTKFKDVTLEMAVRHPVWSMGPKISIDSATLANKGLEVLEAIGFFGYKSTQIDVVIHPQSVVHSLVRVEDGSLFAHLSPPDMTLPVVTALQGEFLQLENVSKELDFTNLNLSFDAVDYERFPLLRYAFECAKLQAGYPIAFNAANEIAVEAFVNKRITFDKISSLVALTLEENYDWDISCLTDVLEVDSLVRSKALTLLKGRF
jgi:1-deoxy-D-xylulose-5-phosphate reductoisomerase